MTIYTHTFNGVPVATGDVLCMQDGEPDSLLGRIWTLIGRLAPGEIDHCIVYLGPGGRCVESGPKGVVVFDMPGESWDAPALHGERWILDTLVGAAYPLAGRGLSPEEEARRRQAVAEFCLAQAEAGKPYNLNYFDPEKDGAYYCSQLVYQAYLAHGIDLNTNQGVPGGALARIVFPHEIWNACEHRRANPK